MRTPLRNSDDFQYDADVARPALQQRRLVECFAAVKHGYCQYYASAMVVLLPQHRTSRPASARGSCRASASIGRHRDRLDEATPTPGSRCSSRATAGTVRPDRRRPGSASRWPRVAGGVPSGSATPSRRARARTADTPRPSSRSPTMPARTWADVDRPGPGNPGRSSRSALLLMLVVGGLAFVVVAARSARRGDAGLGMGDGRPARARFGFGPRPTQTVYEYASTLGDVVPIATAELETVARAKVEVAYGQAPVDDGCAIRARRSPPAGRACCGSSSAGVPGVRRRRSAAAATRRGEPGLERARPRAVVGDRLGRSSRSGARCPWRCGARRSGRPPRISTTVIPHSANGEHPEALERQVEQRQQEHLEHAVVADHDRPRRRPAGRRSR